MPKRDLLLADVQREQGQAALLVAQVGAMPTELQLIVQTAEFDPAVNGLRPLHSYLIRVAGVLEHRIANLGMTVGDVVFTDDHPLLYATNTPPTAVFFRGQAADPHELALDIAQAHAQTFQGWRHFPEYLNMQQALVSLLKSGGGLLGQMPTPLAQQLAKVLEHHGLEHKLMADTAYADKHDNPMLKQQRPSALILGESYFIAYAFYVDEVGKV